MGNFIPFETSGGVIRIQVEDSVDGSLIATVSQDAVFTSFEDVTQAIIENAQYIKELLAALDPSSIEISFGIKAGVNPGSIPNTGTPIFGLSMGTDMANYKIKVKWEADKNES